MNQGKKGLRLGHPFFFGTARPLVIGIVNVTAGLLLRWRALPRRRTRHRARAAAARRGRGHRGRRRRVHAPGRGRGRRSEELRARDAGGGSARRATGVARFGRHHEARGDARGDRARARHGERRERLPRPTGAIEAVARAHVGLIVMHMQGTPRHMQDRSALRRRGAEVSAFLRARLRRCDAAGVARERIALDPGFGFGKTVEHNKAALPRAAGSSHPHGLSGARGPLAQEDARRFHRAAAWRRARRRERCRGAARGAEWREHRSRARREGHRRCAENWMELR